jgi:hypothetical protein
MYMGFKTVYLIGAGYTYQPYQWFHFYDPYDTEEYKEYEKLNCASKPPPFHYTIKALSDKYGVQILNVVPDGYNSPIYEAISLEKFKKKFNLS